MSAPRPLAILHVDPERGFGGGERQVEGLMRHLRAGGQRQALAAEPAAPIAAAATRLDVALVPLRIRNHADVLAGRRLAGLLARERYDIVHFHTARAHAMAAFLGASSGLSRVVTRRMDYRLRGGWYMRRLYNHGVDAVVAISDGVRAVLMESGVDPTRIHVIPSGVEAETFVASTAERAAARAHFRVGPEHVLLAIVGALETRKGHAVLLDALARLADPRLRLVCAGGGSQLESLGARATALGLGDVVRWLGRLDDVVPVLAAADIVVMASLQEGLGVAALEAMAAGRPVVASRVGGLPDAVLDGETGLLVPPGDPAALANAIARLASDGELRSALGRAGAARVRAHFTTTAMATATLALYRQLAGVSVEHG